MGFRDTRKLVESTRNHSVLKPPARKKRCYAPLAAALSATRRRGIRGRIRTRVTSIYLAVVPLAALAEQEGDLAALGVLADLVRGPIGILRA